MEDEIDLNLILEKELESIELGDNDDNIIDSLFNYEDNYNINHSATSSDESNPDDELRAIIESSTQLTHLNSNEAHTENSDETGDSILNDSNGDEEMTPLPSSSQLPIIATDIDLANKEEKDSSRTNNELLGNPYESTLLSTEERSVIEELVAMMLDAVEQCAPIYKTSEVNNDNSDRSVTDEDGVARSQKLVIIDNDEDVRLDLSHENDNSNCDTVVENERIMADVLIELMKKENEKSKFEQIAAAQARETIEWEESNAFKEALERDRQQRLERNARREREKLAAAKEKAVTNMQRFIRGNFGRKRVTLLRADREAQLCREAAERAAVEEKQFLELEFKNQAIELLAMTSAEQESKTIWKAQAMHERLLQQTERKSFADEDTMSNQLREMALAEAREKVKVIELAKRKAELLAEPDEEYDFELEDDCTESSDGVDVTDNLTIECKEHEKATENCCSFVPKQPLEPPSMRRLSSRFVNNPISSDTRTSGNVIGWGGTVSISAQVDNLPTNTKTGTAVQEAIPLLSSINLNSAGLDDKLPPVESITQEHFDALKESWSSLAVDCLKIYDSEISYSMDETEKEVTESILDCLVDETLSSVTSTSNINSPILSSLIHWIAHYQDPKIAIDQGKNFITSNSKQLSTSKLQQHGSPVSVENDDDEEDTEETASALNSSINYTGPVDLSSDPKGVRELDLCVEDIPDVLFLQRFKWIEKLLLNVNKLTNLTGIEKLKRLKILQVKDNNIVDISTIRNLKDLQHLHLDCNRISDVSILDNLNDLRTVSLCTNNITEVPRIQCKQLQRLEIYRNRISHLSDDSLKGFPSLIHLDLGYNKLTTVSGNALSSCSLLQTVILSQNMLKFPPYPLRLPMLKSLWLNGNQISSVDCWQPSDGNPWPLFVPVLQKLYLRDNQVSFLPDSVTEQLPMLQELDMSFNVLSSRSSLQSIHNCPLLSAIHIQDNPLTTVRNEASGTSTSVPLSEDEQASLHRWLADMCHALQTVSGNSIQKDQDIVKRIRTKALWKFVVYKQNIDSLSSLNSELRSKNDRELLHLLKTFILAQTAASSREKIVKRNEIKNSKLNPDHKTSTLSIDWELDYKDILLDQIRKMIEFGKQLTSSIAPSDFYGVGFINYNQRSDDRVLNDVESPIEVVSVDTLNIEPEVVPEFYFDQELCRGKSFETNDNAYSAAVVIQRTFRGSRVRRRLGSVMQSLASIHYEDKELDDMLNMDGEMGSLFDIDEMTELLEFADMDYDPLKGSERNMTQLSSSSNTIGGGAMVYGDHIRRRRTSDNSISVTETASVPDRTHDSGWFAPPNNDSSQLLHEQNSNTLDGSRPSTGMSSVSARTISQGDSGLSTPGFSTPLNGNDNKTSIEFSDDLPTARSQASTASRTSKAESKRIEAAELAKEWGISDPKVLAAMMKRNKRMKHFMHADEARAQSKDPIARLDRFLRNAHRGGANASTTGISQTRGNTNTSGSFGGKPKTLRQTGKKRTMAVPAWMIGDNDSAT